MIELRPYQEEAVQSVFTYFETQTGNPLVVLPTGAGKSLTMAAFIRRAIEQYPGTHIVLLTHVKELIKQDYEAIKKYWPEAPVAVWSAGLKSAEYAQVTVAGIQSVHKRTSTFGNTDLIIVDEAHLVSKNSNTMYGRFIGGIRELNPNLKVIGLTATAYRMGTGLLHRGEGRIFTDICYEADVGTLIMDGYLCNLTARAGATKADLEDVHIRNGDFREDELQKAVNQDHLVVGALKEVAKLAAGRRHILGFCAGVEHAEHCAAVARSMGWMADYVTGDMDNQERDWRIQEFKDGNTRILFNANLLTTGFDAPHTDCIVMLRPTMSTGLYVQMLGRGLRKHPDKENTLVLDFAGNVERHGPIDQIKIAEKRAKNSEGVAVAPVKVCPECNAYNHVAAKVCLDCNEPFPMEEKSPHGTEASEETVVAATERPKVLRVWSVLYARHKKKDKPDTVLVEYHCHDGAIYREWIPLLDERPFVRKHATKWFWDRGLVAPETIDECFAMVEADKVPTPTAITLIRDGKYWKVHKSHGPFRPGAGKLKQLSFWELA